MATIDEIKKAAASIRDATEIGENTATRVGSSVYDLAKYAESISSTLTPKVDEMYNEFTDARNAYYVNLTNVYSCIGHLCGSLNTDALPALKVTDEGEKGYSITLWQDGNTYKGANIPLSSSSANGLMSAQQAEDLEYVFDNAVFVEDGKGLSTNDYTDAEKAKLASNTEAIAANKADIASNAKSVAQLSNALVLPFGGTDALISSVEGTAYVAQWGAYGSLPVYASRLNLFTISAGMKHYAAWTHFTNIPDSDKYGSLHVLFYDGTKLYRHTGKALVEITADTSALEARVAALEATLAALTAETIVTI